MKRKFSFSSLVFVLLLILSLLTDYSPIIKWILIIVLIIAFIPFLLKILPPNLKGIIINYLNRLRGRG